MTVAVADSSKTGPKFLGRSGRWALVDIVVVVYALVPVLWTLSLSFKTPEAQTDKYFWPTSWTWQNYKDIFTTSEFIRALINSIGIAIIATLIAVVLGTMAAYAIARLDFPGKQVLVGVSLLIAMFPQVSRRRRRRSAGSSRRWPRRVCSRPRSWCSSSAGTTSCSPSR
jgi:multiple sugar transport system permease protein